MSALIPANATDAALKMWNLYGCCCFQSAAKQLLVQSGRLKTLEVEYLSDISQRGIY